MFDAQKCFPSPKLNLMSFLFYFYFPSSRILIDCNIDYNMQKRKGRGEEEEEVKLIYEVHLPKGRKLTTRHGGWVGGWWEDIIIENGLSRSRAN